MLLYVMRHGPAEDNSPSGRDADRRLTPEGRELVKLAARELAQTTDAARARLFASPLARALETAEIMRHHVAPAGRVDQRDELIPTDDPPYDFLRELLDADADALLVGHQPGVEHLVRLLADHAGRAVIPFGFRTAMVVGLEITPDLLASAGDPVGVGSWRLRMILDPRRPAPK